jgi:hypothetical protein
MNPDPLTIPETDEEPWTPAAELTHEKSRDVLLACLGLGVVLAIAAWWVQAR